MGNDIAVVGGGIFGVTTAVHLSEAGHEVVLFEKRDGILQGASGHNQFRLHRGYHYPRSPTTAQECLQSEESFLRVYGDAVVDAHPHYYAIAAEDSKTSAEEYVDFLDRFDLEYRRELAPGLRKESIDLCVRADESVLDPQTLREICESRLRKSAVDSRLNERATPDKLARFDRVILATYERINRLLPSLTDRSLTLKYEVCEKPVARLPATLRGQSVVVMDGPFMCFDPLGRSSLSVCGNVTQAVHHRTVGPSPEIPGKLQPLLNRGVITDPSPTRFAQFIGDAAEFFRGIRQADHAGSMYTVRTVLPNVEDTDERPTLVQPIDDRVIVVFSGKLGTAVSAAYRVEEYIEGGGRSAVVRYTDRIS